MQALLDVLQEESAEVIQAVSKVRRFGMSGVWDGKTDKERLETEVGDLLAVIILLCKGNALDSSKIDAATQAKFTKLLKYGVA